MFMCLCVCGGPMDSKASATVPLIVQLFTWYHFEDATLGFSAVAARLPWRSFFLLKAPANATYEFLLEVMRCEALVKVRFTVRCKLRLKRPGGNRDMCCSSGIGANWCCFWALRSSAGASIKASGTLLAPQGLSTLLPQLPSDKASIASLPPSQSESPSIS